MKIKRCEIGVQGCCRSEMPREGWRYRVVSMTCVLLVVASTSHAGSVWVNTPGTSQTLPSAVLYFQQTSGWAMPGLGEALGLKVIYLKHQLAGQKLTLRELRESTALDFLVAGKQKKHFCCSSLRSEEPVVHTVTFLEKKTVGTIICDAHR